MLVDEFWKRKMLFRTHVWFDVRGIYFNVTCSATKQAFNLIIPLEIIFARNFHRCPSICKLITIRRGGCQVSLVISFFLRLKRDVII